MIKAVFFDWFNTLAHYDPPREETESRALQEFGITVPADRLRYGILIADKEYFEENLVSPIRQRSTEEQARVNIRYQKTVLDEAKISAPEDLLYKIIKRLQESYARMTFVLFDDVLPILKTLKERNFTLGLLTNIHRGIEPICQKLGVAPYLDFTVTSGEAGADKPQPRIFMLALEQAGVTASEVVHVGDQYKLDVVGARGVGIAPILIDRSDSYPDVDDCPRIHSLTELFGHISQN